MQIPFIKMHGLGNDFVVLDGRTSPLPALSAPLVRALSNRHTGIGCDQFIVLGPSQSADFRMRIFNADGGEVEACGNATRVAGLLHGRAAKIETLGGIVTAVPHDGAITVDMGAPGLVWDQIPLAYAMDTCVMPVGWDDLTQPSAVSMGNPHVIFFVKDVNAIDLASIGPVIEHDPLFPDRVNVSIAAITGPDEIALRVWERGAGLTLACGTGACATAVAAMRRRLTGRRVKVNLPGGMLEIEWDGQDHVLMTGPAEESFRGSFNLATFAGGVYAAAEQAGD